MPKTQAQVQLETQKHQAKVKPNVCVEGRECVKCLRIKLQRPNPRENTKTGESRGSSISGLAFEEIPPQKCSEQDLGRKSFDAVGQGMLLAVSQQARKITAPFRIPGGTQDMDHLKWESSGCELQ